MQRVLVSPLGFLCNFVVVDNLGKSYKHLDKPVSGTKEVKEASPFPQPHNCALCIKRVSLNFGMYQKPKYHFHSIGTVKGLSTNAQY
jgi:hypothetical protein